MKKKKFFNNAVDVRRITIDEKLSDNYIRLLVSNLKMGDNGFFDWDENIWSEEKEIYVNDKDFIDKMKIIPSKIKEYKWEALKEGQVFLSGEFKLFNKNRKDKFIINKGRKNFRQIDKEIRRNIEPIYFNVLTGGKSKHANK